MSRYEGGGLWLSRGKLGVGWGGSDGNRHCERGRVGAKVGPFETGGWELWQTGRIVGGSNGGLHKVAQPALNSSASTLWPAPRRARHSTLWPAPSRATNGPNGHGGCQGGNTAKCRAERGRIFVGPASTEPSAADLPDRPVMMCN